MTTHSQVTVDPILEAAGSWCLKIAAGALTAQEQQRFEAWIHANPEHLRAFEDAVGVWRASGETVASSPPLLALRRQALASLEQGNPSNCIPRKSGWRVRLLAAAAAGVAAIGIWGVWMLSQSKTYETAIGERRTVTLSDGSKLSLDAATEVVVKYSKRLRSVQLESGRAKFDVAKDASRPFRVAAADKTIIATGTAFSVELVQGMVDVVLFEGHVKVLTRGPNGQSRPINIVHAQLASRSSQGEGSGLDESERTGRDLEPGQELVTPISATSAKLAAADTGRSLAWESGQLVFTSEPLASAIERVNRYSNRKVTVGDSEVGSVRIDGVFAAGNTDAFIEGIEAVFPVRAQEAADGIILTLRNRSTRNSSHAPVTAPPSNR